MAEKTKNIKIVLIGDPYVGKTSLRKRYMGEGFRQSYTATIGVDYSVKKIQDKTINIFDLAGDPTSKILREQFYGGTDGIILIFDITNRQSFENLPQWFDEVRSNLHPDLKIFVLGNKDDLREESENPVSEVEAYQYVRRLEIESNSSISYLSTSALTGYNVDAAFTKLLTVIEFS